MKRILVVLVTTGIFSLNAYAADDGFYAGIQGGYGNIGYNKSNLTSSGAALMNALNSTLVSSNNMGDVYDIQSATLSPTSTQSSLINDDNFAGRLFIGYQFNPYIAVETGYTKYFAEMSATSQYYGSGKVGTGLVLDPIKYSNATADIIATNQISENVADVNAKLIYPVPNTRINIYTKLGAAYVDPNDTYTVQKISVNAQGMKPSQINASSANVQESANVGVASEICPEVSPGISYDINNHLSADVSWTFIKGLGEVQNINFANVGLTYHFE